MRKVAIALGVIVLVLVLTLAAVLLFVDVNHYREPIQAQLEQQLGRKVTLGQMSLGLLPPRFQVADVIVAEDRNFPQESPFVRADALDVRIDLLSLLRRRIKVDWLELRRPSVELVRNQQGTWNFSTLGRGTSGGSTATSEDTGSALVLDRLTILDGQLGVTDLQHERTRTVYDHIDLNLLNYKAGQPFSFDMAAHIQDQGAQEVRVRGEAGPLSPDKPADTPFRGTLTLDEVGIDGLQKFLDTEMLANATGFLSGETQLTNKPGLLTAAGNLKLEMPRFNNLDIGYPISLDYDTKIADGVVTINSAMAQLGPTPLSLSGSLNTNSTPPELNLNVKSGDVSIAEIARLTSAFGIAFAPGAMVTGRVAADVQLRGPTAKPALTGTIKGSDLKISDQGIPQPVSIKTLDLALSPSEIRSNEFNATSGKTTVTARFNLRQYTSDSPSIDVGVRAPNATLPEIQSIAKAYGMTGLDQIAGKGSLNLDLRAAGPLHAVSSTDVTRLLNGTMSLDFSPLRISGFDTAHQLANIGGFASGLTDQGFTDIAHLTGHIAVKNGVAQTNDLRAQLGVGSLAVTGTADLAAQTLNLKVSSVLSKEFTDKVGGTRVSGYLHTALSNTAGELVIPAIVTGTFKEPKFAPDVQAFVRMQKQRLLPNLQNPGAAITGLLGALTSRTKKTEDQTKEENATETKTQETKPEDTIKSILGGFFGNKKDEESK